MRNENRQQIGDATLYLGDCREILPTARWMRLTTRRTTSMGLLGTKSMGIVAEGRAKGRSYPEMSKGSIEAKQFSRIANGAWDLSRLDRRIRRHGRIMQYAKCLAGKFGMWRRRDNGGCWNGDERFRYVLLDMRN